MLTRGHFWLFSDICSLKVISRSFSIKILVIHEIHFVGVFLQSWISGNSFLWLYDLKWSNGPFYLYLTLELVFFDLEIVRMLNFVMFLYLWTLIFLSQLTQSSQHQYETWFERSQNSNLVSYIAPYASAIIFGARSAIYRLYIFENSIYITVIWV